MNNKGFTLIELLVVVAIIGVLAAVSLMAFSSYTESAQRSATLTQHKDAVKFIQSYLAKCDLDRTSTVKISQTKSINCNIQNTASGINSLNNIFIRHFLDEGWKNPYGDTSPVVYTGRNSSQDRNGRMRFDETECSSGSSKKQIALWVKTHKEYYPTLIAKRGWCG
tara:strand:+ start:142 stop:639 length:498 start_codon:yes stop_codon:yes gene_type:complete